MSIRSWGKIRYHGGDLHHRAERGGEQTSRQHDGWWEVWLHFFFFFYKWSCSNCKGRGVFFLDGDGCKTWYHASEHVRMEKTPLSFWDYFFLSVFCSALDGGNDTGLGDELAVTKLYCHRHGCKMVLLFFRCTCWGGNQGYGWTGVVLSLQCLGGMRF